MTPQMPSRSALSPDDIAAQLKAQYGVDPERARYLLTIGKGGLDTSYPVMSEDDIIVEANYPVALPLRFTLPWSALCSDNERERASLRAREGKPEAFKVLGARYKTAREKTRDIARQAVGTGTPLEIPLTLEARVYVPDARPHDVCNFAKGVHDALERIVYVNDRWLHRVVWELAGIDTDAPRAEIAIWSLADVGAVQ